MTTVMGLSPLRTLLNQIDVQDELDLIQMLLERMGSLDRADTFDRIRRLYCIHCGDAVSTYSCYCQNDE